MAPRLTQSQNNPRHKNLLNKETSIPYLCGHLKLRNGESFGNLKVARCGITGGYRFFHDGSEDIEGSEFPSAAVGDFNVFNLLTAAQE